MKPSDKVMAWKKSDAYQRVENCRVMLLVHDFISESENQNINHRLEMWRKKHDFIPCLGPASHGQRTKERT